MVKKAGTLQVKKKRNGRYFVKQRGGGVVNGEEKVKVLVEAGILKPAKKKEAPAAEAPAT